MKAKKTISVELIRNFANEQLAHPNNTLGEKLGIITMIEEVLCKSNAYKGFMFLNAGDNKIGTDDWATRKYF